MTSSESKRPCLLTIASLGFGVEHLPRERSTDIPDRLWPLPWNADGLWRHLACHLLLHSKEDKPKARSHSCGTGYGRVYTRGPDRDGRREPAFQIRSVNNLECFLGSLLLENTLLVMVAPFIPKTWLSNSYLP